MGAAPQGAIGSPGAVVRGPTPGPAIAAHMVGRETCRYPKGIAAGDRTANVMASRCVSRRRLSSARPDEPSPGVLYGGIVTREKRVRGKGVFRE